MISAATRLPGSNELVSPLTSLWIDFMGFFFFFFFLFLKFIYFVRNLLKTSVRLRCIALATVSDLDRTPSSLHKYKNPHHLLRAAPEEGGRFIFFLLLLLFVLWVD